MKKNLILMFLGAFITLFVLLGQTLATAAVLGTQTSEKSTEFAQGTIYHANTFYSSSVGQQTEHYVTYTPNPDVVPILTNGASLYGKRTVTQANSHLQGIGINSAIGMNADFFSFQTGVPMSNVIIEGKVISKDSGWLPAVGIRADGTAFMGTMPITTTISDENGYIPVECINKYRQPYSLYLYTQDFAYNTHASGKGINVVLGSLSGDITLDSSITAVVESITTDSGSVEIPAGKIVVSVDASASSDLIDRMNIFEVGKKVTIDTKLAVEDNRWLDAQYALGATGGKLITNGQLDYSDEAAAPRTAIGITADGKIIFYTIDGRQSGYSYGVRKETLARRLLELGCVEAINLDGGGSTSLGGVLPGTTNFKVLNSPSDGGLRSCANFFFLKKNNAPDGIPYILNVSHWGIPILSGSTVQLKVTNAYDISYGPANIPDDIVFTLGKDASTAAPSGLKTEVSQNGFVQARGNGDIYINANSSTAKGSTMLRVVATPDELKIFNSDTNERIYDLTLNPNDTINLSATAYWGGQAMIVNPESFTWRAVSNDESIGSITNDGVFTASANNGAMGIVAVNAGLCTLELPLRITEVGEEIGKASYPDIYGEVREEEFVVTLIDENGNIPKENISLAIDGKKVSFTYNEETGSLTYPLDETFKDDFHRITLIVTNNAGASRIEVYDSGDWSQMENSFPDTEGHWASAYISYMVNNKVVKGSDDGYFYPDKSMNRTEFAIMLCNYLGIDPLDYQDVILPFTDAYEIPWWALNNVKAVYSLGIMQGQLTDYGVEFKPYADIQRIEYAISIGRLLPPGLMSAPIYALDEADIPFWGKESMKIATAQGIINGYPDGTLKPRRSVTRAEAVKILYTVFGVGK